MADGQEHEVSGLAECLTDTGWNCPVMGCGSILSRKQTLRNHLFAIHNVQVEGEAKRYKLYDIDSSVPIPRSTTHYHKRQRLQDGHDVNEHTVAESASRALDSWQKESDGIMTTVDYCEGEADMDLCDFDSSNNQEDEDVEETDLESDDAEEINNKQSPPLYVHCPSNEIQNSGISYQSHVLSICAFSLKHNMSGIGFKDAARLVKIHLPEQSICETDITKIKKMCSNMDDEVTIHEYCLQCSGIFQKDPDVNKCLTPGCSGQKTTNTTKLDKKNIFISTPLEMQIKSILERENNFKKITAAKSHNSLNIADINSGILYKDMKKPGGFLFPANNNNITLTFFTDGVPLFKSSKVSLWPLYLVINELPPSERFLKKNMLIWGIWQGSTKLRMNTFLYPFVQDLKTLYEKGFVFNIGSKEMTGKACLVIATMDLQARAPVLNMMHHNGEYGCIYCETKGVIVSSGKGHARSYPFIPETFKPRTDLSVKDHAQNALENDRASVGIKGPSVLSALSQFSITQGTVIDYMHGILLGIMKKLLDLWFKGKSYQEDFFLGNQVCEIDKMLKKIKPPYVLKRLPRRIENTYSHWKASECRSWLLHYSLPCLSETTLPDVYLHHFACLVEAIHILLGDNIENEQLARSSILLTSFYEHFSELYGENTVGLNVHNLCHLVSCVKNWGPLWAYSCFGFESFNADILKLVHGTGNVAMQILWSIKAQKELELKTKTLPEGEIKSFFKDMLKGSTRRLPKGSRAHHCQVIKPVEVKGHLSARVISQICEVLNIHVHTGTDNLSQKDFLTCDRIIFGQQVLYSKKCTRVKKRNSFTIEIAELADGSNIMQVDSYIMHKESKKVVAICDLYQMKMSVIRGRAAHCQLIEKKMNEACVLVSMDTVKDLVIYMEGNQGRQYISRLPNFIERD